MLKTAIILAALALGVFAFSNVCSFALPASSSAYECRFGVSPADAQEFDAEWDRWGLEVWKATKRNKWVTVEVVATPEG